MFGAKSFLEFLNMGGISMYVLLLMSIISLAVILNRYLYFKVRLKIKRREFVSIVRGYVLRNEIDKGLKFLETLKNPFAYIAHIAFKMNGDEEKLIANAVDREVAVQVIEFEKYTSILGTIANISVYVGLFGTVIGIIEAFTNISIVGSGGISVVIGGVSKALITTAAGLFIAIPAVVAYNYFIKRIDNLIREMELFSSEIIDMIEKK